MINKKIEYLKKWKSKNKDKVKRQKERHYQKIKNNPLEQLKAKSRRKANYKISIKGVLCFDCKKKQAKTRHHEDYNKPYEVLLLCSNCHLKRHKSVEDFKPLQLKRGCNNSK